MKLGIVIYSNDPETVWNAFRFATFSAKAGDAVKIFLLGKGVEVEALGSDKFPVHTEIAKYLEAAGELYACGTCLKLRNAEESGICPVSTLADLYRIIDESDKVLTF